jgi:hypothetical protein
VSEESGAPSFREAAMARMAQERDEAPPQPAPDHVAGEEPEEVEETEFGTSEPATEEVVDSEEDESIEDGDDIEPDEETDEETDDEVPMDVKYQRLEKQYKDLQRQFTKDRMQREEYESQLSDNMVSVTKTQHELEDSLTGARQMAELLREQWAGNANQFRNIDWSQVPPDKVQQVQQMAQNAMHQEQMANQRLAQLHEQQTLAFQQKMTRQAELASRALQVKIPEWGSETYSSIRGHAESMGLSQEMFNMITEPSVIEMFYHSMLYKGAGKKAKTVAKRKSQKPASANQARQGRNAKGQFMNAKKAFEESPNTRGAFAQMKAAQLAAER